MDCHDQVDPMRLSNFRAQSEKFIRPMFALLPSTVLKYLQHIEQPKIYRLHSDSRFFASLASRQLYHIAQRDDTPVLANIHHWYHLCSRRII